MRSLFFFTLTFFILSSGLSARAEENCPVPDDYPAITRLYSDLVTAGVVLREVKVAIIDSGADQSHPALAGRLHTFEDGSHGISFIPDREFRGMTELARMVHQLSANPSRSPADEESYGTLRASLEETRNDLRSKLEKSRNRITELTTRCESEPEFSDCTKLPSLTTKLRDQDADLNIFNNPERWPYASDLLSINRDTRPGTSDHGTFIAGMIAGKRNVQGQDFNGIAENARLIIIKVINTPDEAELDEQVAEGIRYAVNHQAKVINISLGKYFSSQPQLVLAAFDYAQAQGVSVVLSAGNSGTNNDERTHYPSPRADQQNVFVMGSNTEKSNFGSRVDAHITESNNKDGYRSSVVGGGSKVKKGSSFSAAYTSGVFALALGMNPNLSPDKLRSVMSKNTIPYDHPSGYQTRQLETYQFLREVLEERSP